MRAMCWMLALLIVATGLSLAGCAQHTPPPPTTIGDWMKMEQVHP